MRLVDCYIDAILFSRQLVPNLTSTSTASDGQSQEESSETSLQNEFADVRKKLILLLDNCLDNARDNGFSDELAKGALLPVVAYIDEMILCSPWVYKAQWQKESLQRYFFETTNIGSVFYEKLNELSKYGTDSLIREVYVLCLGLGFKGRYFSNEDRRTLEEIKGFNVALLLPEEAQRNLDTATLFPTAYGSKDRARAGSFKARFNVIPFVIGMPIALSIALVVYYHFNIAQILDQIAKAVN